MNISLQGKHALICGSTQGIGRAVAQELAALGANCILLARNEEKLQQAVRDLPAIEGQHHRYAVADFSDTGAVEQAIREILMVSGVDILVNNTGGPKAGEITEAETAAFENAFRQHVVNNQQLAKAVLPGMTKSGYGRIINIVSTSVKTPLPHLGVSNTIRAAVAAWAKTLANEVGRYGITVNNVLPGLTATERLESLIADTAKRSGKSIEEVETSMQASVPLQRFGTATEIANLVAFLASPAASYITGTSIPVDGGRTPAI